MNVSKDHLTEIAELRAANLALQEEIRALKRSQESLRAHEEKFRTIVEQASEGILVIQGGERKYYNPAWLEMVGLSAEAYAPTPFLSFVYPEDLEMVKAAYERLRSTGEFEPIPDFRLATASGDVRWISVRVSTIIWEGKPAGVIFASDITERKQVEINLQNSEARFRATFEQAAVGIAHVALHGRFLRLNQKFCEIVGYSSDEMLKLTFQVITHPDDLEADLEYVQNLLDGHLATYSMEKRYLKKNGSMVWVNLTKSLMHTLTDEPDYFIAVVEDITERKQIEQALQESELKYRTVVEKATEGILVVQDFERKYYNPALPKISGYSDEEFAAMPFLSPVHPDDQAVIDEIYQKILAAQEVDVYSVFRVFTKSGDIRWLSTHGTAVPWEGRPAAMVFVEDITERKQSEQQIDSYQQRLKALAAQLTLTEEQERRRLATELHDRVGQALAFSRMQIAAAQKAKSDIQRNALLHETSATLKETIQETRSLVFDLSSPLLNELGLNAAIAEWMKEHLEKQAGLETEMIEIASGRQLSVDLRAILFRNVRELLNNIVRHARATHVSVRVEQTDTQIYIAVQDDGIGFDPEAIAPTINRSGGYGLFSIQERMSDLGGFCTIQSAPGEGTKIALGLPIPVS